MEKAQDTTGYRNIKVDCCIGRYFRADSGNIVLEYSANNGGSWTPILTSSYIGTPDWTGYTDISCGSDADNNPQFVIRFRMDRVDPALGNFRGVDKVVLCGDPGPTDTPTNTPTPTDTPTISVTPVVVSLGPTDPIVAEAGSPGNALDLCLENDMNVKGLLLTVVDSPDKVTFSGATVTGRAASHLPSFMDKGDEMTLLLVCIGTDLIGPGSGSVVDFTFDLNSGEPATSAALGFVDVQLADEGGEELPYVLVSNEIVEGGGVVCTPADLDQDGEINLFDILRVIDVILDVPPPPSEYELCAADMNHDQEINIFDVLTMVDLILE
jgi:hypothetical protein